jgi:phosphoribosylanthranilate isomerase
MSRVRVKICGLTRVDDAQVAIDAGAKYLGLIFAASPRKIKIEQALKLIDGVQQPKEPSRWVGVFQDQSLEAIQEIIDQVPLDFVQLHSATSQDFRGELPLPVFQAQPLIATEFVSPRSAVAALMEPVKGNGERLPDWLENADSHDWSCLREWNEGFPLLLAGGLSADNVAYTLDFLRRHDCAPFALDVASGIEKAPGEKDWEKVRAFCKTVHAIETNFSGNFLGDLL